MRRLLILLILAGTGCSEAAFGGDPHHDYYAPVIDQTVVNNAIAVTGQAAIYAATQIHPSENISGFQFGAGIAQFNGRTGVAGGVAFTVPGRAMFNGSIAKEEKDTIYGFGFNVSIKP